MTLRQLDERGPKALVAAAELLHLTVPRVRTAVAYYSAYQDEIDAEMQQAQAESMNAERAWRIERQLLA